LIIAVFGIFPIGYGLYMSMLQWLGKKGDFIGFANYKRIFGDWGGLGLFVAGILCLILAYMLWTRISKTESKWKIVGRLVAAMLLIGMGVLLSFGWDKMWAAGDTDYLTSLMITVYYAFMAVPLQIILGLILAYVLFQNIKGKEFFRMIYFLPYVTPVVSTAVVFRVIFSARETSLANTFFGWVGLDPQKWLFESKPIINIIFGTNFEGFWAGPSLALLCIVLFGVWSFVGYNAVIFLSGLGSISKEIYEAAEIDGANSYGIFRHITIPLISPITFYLFLVSFIGTFKAFNHIFVMKAPQAQHSVITASVEIFNTFYKANNYGYAASQAVVLFLIILGLTLAQNKLLENRVFYG
jgi:multiple sugar transport system permease protein